MSLGAIWPAAVQHAVVVEIAECTRVAKMNQMLRRNILADFVNQGSQCREYWMSKRAAFCKTDDQIRS